MDRTEIKDRRSHSLELRQLAAEMPSVALGAGAWWCHSLLAVSAVSNTLLLNEH